MAPLRTIEWWVPNLFVAGKLISQREVAHLTMPLHLYNLPKITGLQYDKCPTHLAN